MTNRVLGYRGQQVLHYVNDVIEGEGVAPSYGMIRDELGFNCRAEVCHVVARLERRGFLRRVGHGRVRRIRLPAPA